jgi:hypothetical protein
MCTLKNKVGEKWIFHIIPQTIHVFDVGNVKF